MTTAITLWLVATLLVLVQLAAALPWGLLLFGTAFRQGWREMDRRQRWARVGAGLGIIALAAAILAAFIGIVHEPERLDFWGRVYGSVLHLQLAVDVFVLLIGLLLRTWPKGAAVALAAFREGLRQPLFWLLVAAAVVLLVIALFIPYFSFLPGDEYKMMKQLGYDVVMLSAVAFGVIAAATSISEEIEGRTAVTLMSKPVSRRQFLLGKFAGILLAALAMTGLTGWGLDWALYLKPILEAEPITDPLQAGFQSDVTALVQAWSPPGPAASFLQGAGFWLADALAALPLLVIAFCQVMVLLAIATALATRLPMMLNLPICLVIFFLGHLAPVLVQWSKRQQELAGQPSVAWDLTHFVARLCDTLLPALEYSNLAPAIVRDAPLEPGPFAWYVGSVVVYALLYTAIALLFGLILFEDRDLA